MKNKVTISLFLIILIHLSSSCTPIVEQTTLSNTEYEYQIENDIIKITHHRSDFGETKIVVPVEIDGKPVAVLGAETFYQHKNIVSVILPQTLTTILGSPFYRCYALQECNIPANVRQIDANPFFRCSSLTQITVDSSNAYFSAVEGVLFDKGQTTLISYPEGKTNEKYVIPKTVKKLSIDSFGYHTKLKEITILSNVIDFPDGNMFIYPDDIKLIVESGSAAEQYAKKQNLNYETVLQSGPNQGTVL